MRTLESIFEAEKNLALGKKDFLVQKSYISPDVNGFGSTSLGIGSGKEKLDLTDTGLSSYLDKVGVPRTFYKECSPELRHSIATEFQGRVPNQSDSWRIRTLNNKIRFVASSRYAKFDNIDILSALDKIELGGLEVKEHYDDGKHFVLRVCQKEALNTEGRPFFAGIEISNSEVGLRSVKAACMLWEEVCTNGLTIPVKELGSFNMIHAGEKRREIMEGKLEGLINSFEGFAEQSRLKLMEAEEMDGNSLLARIKNLKEIPEGLFHTIENKAKQYALDESSPTYLDVISGYTEGIQALGWGERFHHEDKAGKLLWRIS